MKLILFYNANSVLCDSWQKLFYITRFSIVRYKPMKIRMNGNIIKFNKIYKMMQ